MKTPKRKRAPAAPKAVEPRAPARDIEARDIEARDIEARDIEARDVMDLDIDMAAAMAMEERATAIEPPVSDVTSDADIEATSTMPAPAIVVAEANPTVTLPSNSTVKDAAALKNELVRVAALEATVSLDVRSVERVDTATLQLLCAFVRDRAERKLGVQWLGCPPAFVESSRLLGVHKLLALPEAGVA